MHAPTLLDIERHAQAAIEALPEAFRARLGALVLRIEDWPEDDLLDDLERESPYDLTGLYTGGGATALAETGQLPDTVHLFRRPILDEWADGDWALADLVAHVVVHEIGHHFGLSDPAIEALEASVSAAQH